MAKLKYKQKKFSMLDQLLFCKQTGGKIQVGNTKQHVTKYKMIPLMNGMAAEHRFFMNECIITVVEDKR